MANEDSTFDKDTLQTFIQFLSKSSPLNIRGIAMDYLLGCTGTKDGMSFIGNNPNCLTSIIELMDDEDVTISKNAYKSLVNLTAESEIAAKIAALPNFASFVLKLLQSCLSDNTVYAHTSSKVVCNLSRWEECSLSIKQYLSRNESDVSMCKVVEAFSKSPVKTEYLANFLSNMSCQQEIRKLILDKNRCIIQRLLPLLSSESNVVRQGIAGTLRNCCFETEYHEWLLSSAVDILPRLLLPLAGPEEFDSDDIDKLPDDLQYLGDDKKREPEADIRQMLVETINKLCATKACRQYIKDKNAYVIIRELHKWEKSPVVLAAVENLVSVLISDEPEEGMENLDTVEIPEYIDSKLKNLEANECSHDSTS